jgi:hypothetical protein
MIRSPVRRPFLASLTLSSLACTSVPTTIADPGDDTRPQADTTRSPAAVGELPQTYRFAFVTLGKRAGFYEMVDKHGPALIEHVWFEDLWPEVLNRTIEAAFGTHEQRWEWDDVNSVDGRSVQLDRAGLAELGLEAPSELLWLIGPDGPCRADFGDPVLSLYTWGLDAVELSWRLSLRGDRPGCVLENPQQWSQIAVFADSLPADLRYVEIEQGEHWQVEPSSWASPYAGVVGRAIARYIDGQRDYGVRIDEVWVREVVVPGTALVELTVALVERDQPAPGDEPEPCMDAQDNLVILGERRGAAFQELASADLHPWSELRGAFVRGSEVLWTVHEQRGQAWVLAPELETPASELTVAIFHEEDFGEPPFTQTEYCGP